MEQVNMQRRGGGWWSRNGTGQRLAETVLYLVTLRGKYILCMMHVNSRTKTVWPDLLVFQSLSLEAPLAANARRGLTWSAATD